MNACILVTTAKSYVRRHWREHQRRTVHDMHDSVICQVVLEGTLLNSTPALAPGHRMGEFLPKIQFTQTSSKWPLLPPRSGTLLPDPLPEPKPDLLIDAIRSHSTDPGPSRPSRLQALVFPKPAFYEFDCRNGLTSLSHVHRLLGDLRIGTAPV